MLLALGGSLLCAASTPSHALRLLAADTAGSDTADFALPAQPVLAPVTQVRLRFDAALAPLSAWLPGTFRLISAGDDDVLSTVACGALPVGDDVAVPLALTTLHDDGREIALHVATATALQRGSYRVLACDSLLDVDGVALDGDDDGVPGGSAWRDFTVFETSHAANPGFDTAIAGWSVTPAGSGVSTLDRVALDADGAASSGALRLTSSASFARIEPPVCVPVPHSGTVATRTRLRYRVLEGNVRVVVRMWAGFTGDAGETGCEGPGAWHERVFVAAPSPHFATFDSGWDTLPNFPLASVSMRITPTDGQPYRILFDDLGFSLDSRLIFRDTFLGY